MRNIATAPLHENVENLLFEFMNRDKVSHFYAIYDLRHMREKTLAWVAMSNNRILGYMIEYDKRILYMRGDKECAVSLLRNSSLAAPLLNIEPQHLPAVSRLFKPTEPADTATSGLITTFTSMKATPPSFKPLIRHNVQELEKEDAQALGELLGTEAQRALDLLTGVTFGIFKDNRLVSFAASPETLEDLAIIRGVTTAPEERNQGYATSVCSALVGRRHQQSKDVFLYVSKDNPAAIKVYRKIGFKETGHVFLAFMAKNRRID